VTGLPQTQPSSKPLALPAQVVVLFLVIWISVLIVTSLGDVVAKRFNNGVMSKAMWLLELGFEAMLLAGLFTYCYRRRARRSLQALAVAFSLYVGMIILWFALWWASPPLHF
jgi:hypothetical protein